MSGGQVSQQEAEDIRVEIDEAVQSLKNITNLVLEKLNDTQLPADELEALHESLRGLSSFSKQIKLAVEKVKEKVDASDGVSGVPHSQSGAPVDATPSGSEVSEHPPVATASTSPSKPSDSSAANSASEDAAVRAIAQRFELQTEEAEKKKVEDEERRKRTLERKTSMAAVTVKNNITPAVKAKQDSILAKAEASITPTKKTTSKTTTSAVSRSNSKKAPAPASSTKKSSPSSSSIPTKKSAPVISTVSKPAKKAGTTPEQRDPTPPRKIDVERVGRRASVDLSKEMKDSKKTPAKVVVTEKVKSKASPRTGSKELTRKAKTPQAEPVTPKEPTQPSTSDKIEDPFVLTESTPAVVTPSEPVPEPVGTEPKAEETVAAATTTTTTPSPAPAEAATEVPNGNYVEEKPEKPADPVQSEAIVQKPVPDPEAMVARPAEPVEVNAQESDIEATTTTPVIVVDPVEPSPVKDSSVPTTPIHELSDASSIVVSDNEPISSPGADDDASTDQRKNKEKRKNKDRVKDKELDGAPSVVPVVIKSGKKKRQDSKAVDDSALQSPRKSAIDEVKSRNKVTKSLNMAPDSVSHVTAQSSPGRLALNLAPVHSTSTSSRRSRPLSPTAAAALDQATKLSEVQPEKEKHKAPKDEPELSSPPSTPKDPELLLSPRSPTDVISGTRYRRYLKRAGKTLQPPLSTYGDDFWAGTEQLLAKSETTTFQDWHARIARYVQSLWENSDLNAIERAAVFTQLINVVSDPLKRQASAASLVSSSPRKSVVESLPSDSDLTMSPREEIPELQKPVIGMSPGATRRTLSKSQSLNPAIGAAEGQGLIRSGSRGSIPSMPVMNTSTSSRRSRTVEDGDTGSNPSSNRSSTIDLSFVNDPITTRDRTNTIDPSLLEHFKALEALRGEGNVDTDDDNPARAKPSLQYRRSLANLRSFTSRPSASTPSIPIAKLEVKRTPRRSTSIMESPREEDNNLIVEPSLDSVSPRQSKKSAADAEPNTNEKTSEKQVDAEKHQWEDYERVIATGDESSRTSKWDDALSKLKKKRDKIAKEAREEEKRQAALAKGKGKGKGKDKDRLSLTSSPTLDRAAVVPPHMREHSYEPIKRKISFQVAPVIKIEDPDNPRVKKFIEPESDANIRYTIADGKGEAVKIQGATVEKLVQKLTPDVQPDPHYLSCFMLTYRCFMAPSELLDLLQLRWNTPPPDSTKNLEAYKNTTLFPIRMRITNVMKYWLETHWSDFVSDRELLDSVRAFVDKMEAGGLEKVASQIRHVIKLKSLNRDKRAIEFARDAPRPILPPDKKAKFFLMEFSPEEIARQLLLIEFELLRSIELKELLSGGWATSEKDRTSPNIVKMLNWADHVTRWVQSEILQTEDTRYRAITLTRFIWIAKISLRLKNFNGAMEIMSALKAPEIARLRKTWGLLPSEVWKAYEHLDDLFSEEDNWKKYRAALDAAAAEPAVPYLNRILQDLTSVSEKNPDMLPDTELINFSKMYMLEELIAKTHSFQNSPPNFRSSFIAKYIEQFTPLSLNALQELTVRLEAKSKYDTLD